MLRHMMVLEQAQLQPAKVARLKDLFTGLRGMKAEAAASLRAAELEAAKVPKGSPTDETDDTPAGAGPLAISARSSSSTVKSMAPNSARLAAELATERKVFSATGRLKVPSPP